MSGGVDSSVAAFLLKKQGYEVEGVTLHMHGDGAARDEENDAAAAAEKIGIRNTLVNLEEPFQSIKDYFVSEYRKGRTPNPCVVCNPQIKWAALLDYAEKSGADAIATGHYSGIDLLENGRYALRVSDCPGKDQTYVLYRLTQEQLKKTVMPLGSYTKEEVRNIAREAGLAVSEKKDSQEICFIPDHDYAGFIERRSGIRVPEGNFVDACGNVLGKHRGIIHYTVGQRKGLGIAFGKPMFVSEIRAERNEVVLASDEDLYTDRLIAENLCYMGVSQFLRSMKANAKIRYAHRAEKCSIIPITENEAEVIFERPVRAAAPGQSVVFYDDSGYVMGGGFIQ